MKTLRILILIALAIFGLSMSYLSANFNAEGGYMIGAMLSPSFASALQQTMIAIEVLIIISYAVHYLIDTSVSTRLITAIIISGLSVTCLSILFYTGIIDRASDFKKASHTGMAENNKREIYNEEIIALNKKIKQREKWGQEEKQQLLANNNQSRAIQIKITKELKIIGAECPSKKYKSRCKKVLEWKHHLSNIRVHLSNKKIRALETEIEQLRDKITTIKRMASVSEAYEVKTEQDANDNQGILRFKPDSMELETFAGIFSLIWAISLEFLKTLPILWFFKILLETQKTAKKMRMDPYGKMRMGLVWLIRVRNDRKLALAKIREKSRGKEQAKLEFQQKEKEKTEREITDSSVFSVSAWMAHINVKKLKKLALSQLKNRQKRTDLEVFSAMVCLTIKTYAEENQVKINELVDAIHADYPESKGRGKLTYAMMRDKIFPLLVYDLQFIKKTDNGFFWKTELEIITIRNQLAKGETKPKLRIVRNEQLDMFGGIHA